MKKIIIKKNWTKKAAYIKEVKLLLSYLDKALEISEDESAGSSMSAQWTNADLYSRIQNIIEESIDDIENIAKKIK